MKIKNVKYTSLIFLLTLFSAGTLVAQECSKYYPMSEGTSFEYTMLDRKGNPDGLSKYKVTAVDETADGTRATMAITYEDDKGDEVYNTEFNLTCNNNMVTIDYESLINADMMKPYKDMEMEITGNDIELPNDLGVGQELPDANVSMTISMGAMNMKMNVDQVNRKVEKKESVTTSAGTFDCMVVYSENQTKMMMANKTYTNRIWLAEGVGMVKQEMYNQKGKLVSSVLLTSFSR